MRGVTEITPSFLYVSPFQPALPMRGVTRYPQGAPSVARFQPALPMRGVTVQLASAVAHGFISTRTPHAGSDGEFAVGALDRFIISTRTPHAGSDDCYTPADVYECVFQPALPMRGVTAMVDTLAIALSFQPALPMRGVTRRCPAPRPTPSHFNPHSPCGE